MISEKIGGAKGTELDSEFLEYEKVAKEFSTILICWNCNFRPENRHTWQTNWGDDCQDSRIHATQPSNSSSTNDNEYSPQIQRQGQEFFIPPTRGITGGMHG